MDATLVRVLRILHLCKVRCYETHLGELFKISPWWGIKDINLVRCYETQLGEMFMNSHW